MPVGSVAVADTLTGSVLTSTPLQSTQLTDGAASGAIITYRTTDEHGQPAVSSGVVQLPSGNPPPGGWPIISWGNGTVGLGDQCAAGERLRQGLELPYAASLAAPVLSSLLKSGTAVVSTDYIGLGSEGDHHYLAATAEGNAMIDIVRAARELDPALSTVWASAGHSQGGQAALAANHSADTYAPELDFRGTVALAPASNTERAIGLLDPLIPSIPPLRSLTPLFVFITAGLADSRPDIDVDSYLTERGRTVISQARTMCTDELANLVAGISPQELIARPLHDGVFDAALVDYMALPTSGWTHPVNISHGTADQRVPFPLSVALDTQIRGSGGMSDLTLYPGIDHFSLVSEARDTTVAQLTRLVG